MPKDSKVLPTKKENSSASSISSDSLGIPPTKTVKVYVLRIFKGGKLLNASKGDIIDIDIQNPWQHKLLESGNYLLTGNVYNSRASISMCSWYERWHKITIVQKWGLKKYYGLNCHCRTTYCPPGEYCERNEFGCKWNVATQEIGLLKTDCKSRISLCVFFREFKRCSWVTPSLICREP